MTIGWTRFRTRSQFLAVYTPSIVAWTRYSEQNALNHELTLSAVTRMGSRWTFSSSAAGMVQDIQHSFFAPIVLSREAGMSFDNLVEDSMSGSLSNDQMAAQLTGAPVIASPAAVLLYGNRVLKASWRNVLAYSWSPRTTIAAGFIASRNQSLSENDHGPQFPNFIRQTTMGEASLSISHSLSPRTHISARLGSRRTFYRLGGYYQDQLVLSLAHAISSRWYLAVTSGARLVRPVRSGFGTAHRPRYIGTGSLGYKTYAHTITASYGNSNEEYEFGAVTGQNVAGVWQWRKPGRPWAAGATFSRQQIDSRSFPSLETWRTSASFSRSLSSGVVLSAQYAYLSYSGAFFANLSGVSRSAVRLSLSWSPHLLLLP